MAKLLGGLDDEVLRSAGERAVNGTLAGQVTVRQKVLAKSAWPRGS